MRHELISVDSKRTRAVRQSARDALAAFGGRPAVDQSEVTPWPAARKKHIEPLRSVVESGRYHRVNHPIVTGAERDLARWSKFWDARAVGSGTSAIHIALDYFRRDHRKVVTAALNWPGAVGPIAFSGMEPEFVDVELDTASIEERAAADRLDGEVGALLITHLFGNNIVAPQLRAAARRHGIAVVDDVCQSIAAIGAVNNGRALDSDALALSGNGAKHLGAGELGFVLTRDPGLIEHVDRVSLTSSSRNGERVFSPSTQGYNYRPNVFSAALAQSRIARLDHQLEKRRRNAKALWRSIRQLDGLVPLFNPADRHNSFLNFPLRIDTERMGLPASSATRDFIVDLLKAEGVPVWVWLTKPVFEYLPAWKERWSSHDFPNTIKLLNTMFYVSEIAPPNGTGLMKQYSAAFEKVWRALPELRPDFQKRETNRGH